MAAGANAVTVMSSGDGISLTTPGASIQVTGQGEIIMDGSEPVTKAELADAFNHVSSMTIVDNDGAAVGSVSVNSEGKAEMRLNGHRVLTEGDKEDLIPDSYFDSWFSKRDNLVYGSRVYDATNFTTNSTLKRCDLQATDHDNTSGGLPESSAVALASVAKLGANAGKVHVMSHGSQDGSEAFAGRDDYESIHLFMWKNCNYIRMADGTPRPTAIENEYGIFHTTGAGVDVGVIGPTFWWGTKKTTINGVNYDEIYISDSPGHEECPWPWIESVRPDGSVAPYYIHSKYMGGVDIHGDIVSQPGLFMVTYCSHNTLVSSNITTGMGAWHPDSPTAPVYPFQHKGPGYWGGGMSIYTFGVIFDLIKNATKDGWNLHRGCKAWGCNGTNDAGTQADPGASGSEYSGVYLCHHITATGTDEDGLQYVTLGSSSKAFETTRRARFMPGAYVSIGKLANANLVTTLDNTTTNNIIRYAKISKVDYANKRLYLESPSGEAIPVADDLAQYVADGSLNTCKLCTIPFPAGSTDSIPGHHDGNAGADPRCGIWPYRVQGTEYATGYWQVTTDHIKVYNNGEDGMWYAAPWVPRTNNASTIMSKYKKAGTWTMTHSGDSVGNATFTEQGTLIPEVALDASATATAAKQEGWRSKMYYSTNNVNEVLVGCALSYLTSGGSLFVTVSTAVAGSVWTFGCRD